MKTAGTSIEIFLSQCCGDADVVTPIKHPIEPHIARNYGGYWNPFPEVIASKGRGIKKSIRQLVNRGKYFNHISAQMVKISAQMVKNRISSRIWNEYFKFCVERNPWDKTLSHYHMINYRSGGSVKFEDYLLNKKLCINYPRYTDQTGNQLVDEVIRYESLTDGLTQIFNELAIPFEGSLGTTAKSEYRRDRRPYQEIYSNEQKKLIEEIFVKEIKMFGYSF